MVGVAVKVIEAPLQILVEAVAMVSEGVTLGITLTVVFDETAVHPLTSVTVT